MIRQLRLQTLLHFIIKNGLYSNSNNVKNGTGEHYNIFKELSNHTPASSTSEQIIHNKQTSRKIFSYPAG